MNRKEIRWYNKNRNKDNYRKIINENFPDNKKCRICGDIIYYYDASFIFFRNNRINKTI